MSYFASIRKRLGLSQKELATALGCSRSHIAMIEKGSRAPGPLLYSKLKALETNEVAMLSDTSTQPFVTFKQKKDFEFMRRLEALELDKTSLKLSTCNRKLRQLTTIADELQLKLKYVTGIEYIATELKYRVTIEKLEKLSESTMNLYFKERTTIALIAEIDAIIATFELPETTNRNDRFDQ